MCLYEIKHMFLIFSLLPFPQSCTAQILATWSTPPGPCPILNSWWEQPFSTAATPASSYRAAPLSPATAASQGPRCGRLDYPIVSVSIIKDKQTNYNFQFLGLAS